MKNKVLKILDENGQLLAQTIVDKTSVLVGRANDCDLSVDSEDLAKHHIRVSQSADSYYIENISLSGLLLFNGDPVEYGELKFGDEYHLGGLKLVFVEEDAEVEEEESKAPEDNSEVPEGPIGDDGFGGGMQLPVFGQAMGDGNVMAPLDPDVPMVVESEEEKTRLVAQDVKASLKIIKGPGAGQLIQLDRGAEWIGGRGQECQIYLEDPKISREHFKIVRIGTQFRVQDMGSSRGLRLNGMNVSDAPLMPFDVIQLGPVELQFLIVDSSQQVAEVQSQDNPPQQVLQDTIVVGNIGVEASGIGQVPAVFGGVAQQPPPPSSSVGLTSNGTIYSPPPKFSTNEEKPSLAARFAELPPQKKVLFGAVAVFLVALITVTMMDDSSEAPAPTVSTPTAEQASDKSSVEVSNMERDIPAEFYKLSSEEQQKIRQQYAQASRALDDKDWKAAYEFGKLVDDKIKNFKNVAEILYKAQARLNDGVVGSLTDVLNSLDDAKLDIQERLKMVEQEGRKALKEERWADAEAIFAKGLNLDPTHKISEKGYYAALRRIADLDSVDPQVPDDKNALAEQEKPKEKTPEEKQAEEDLAALAELEANAQQIREKVNTQAFADALNLAESVETKAMQRNRVFLTRAPASISPDIRNRVVGVLRTVREARDVINTQLLAELQTRFADADQFVENQDFENAKRILDQILREYPQFEEARVRREKLYDTIIPLARTSYQEALIYENINNVDGAVNSFKRSRDLLSNVDDAVAEEYYKKATRKLKRLAR